MGASPGGSSGVLSPTNSGGSRAQTPIRLTFSAASSQLGQAAASLSISRNSPLGCPPTPHEVAFAQKMLSRIDDMKGKKYFLSFWLLFGFFFGGGALLSYVLRTNTYSTRRENSPTIWQVLDFFKK